MEFINQLPSLIGRYGLQVLGAIAILFIGMQLAKWVRRIMRNVLERSKFDKTLANFFTNMLYYAMLVFVLIAALDSLGVATSSFVAILGALSLAIGLAAEGSISNIAAGIMLIVLRPFKVGDFVDMVDTEGFVEDIQLFNTTIRTLDNETIILPNTELTSTKITNYSGRPYVRVEVPILVGHDVNWGEAKSLMLDASYNCERVMDEPAAEVQITELDTAGIRLQIEVTCLPHDREDVVYDVLESVKIQFDEAGIATPGQQLSVQIESQKA